MKSILITLSFLSIGITSPFFAQSRFDLGVEAGPNLSTLRTNNNPYIDQQAKMFFSGGFIFQYNTKRILSFKTGFSYQQKGYQMNDLAFMDNNGNILQTGKLVSRLDYISLPLLVKATFGKKINFFVNAGPYIGFLVAKKEHLKVGDFENTDRDISGINRWDFGVSGGIGIGIPIKELWQISVEARNYFGLMDLNSNGNSSAYTNTTDLRIGVVYRLGFRE